MADTTPPRIVRNTDQLIEPVQAEAKRAAGAVFIDVRRARPDAVKGDIAGAIKVDKAIADELIAPESTARLDALANPDAEIVVFCNSEFGSDPVVGKLNDYGYRNVTHVRGGFPAWAESGQPIVGGETDSDADASAVAARDAE